MNKDEFAFDNKEVLAMTRRTVEMLPPEARLPVGTESVRRSIPDEARAIMRFMKSDGLSKDAYIVADVTLASLRMYAIMLGVEDDVEEWRVK